MKTSTSIALKILKFLLKINFVTAVLLLFAVCAMTLTGRYQIFENNVELYGALANNLRLMLFYLALGEINILLYCRFKNTTAPLLWVGFFYILTIGGLEFYSDVNQIPIDPDYNAFFLYEGISHILFACLHLLGTTAARTHEPCDLLPK